MTETQVIIGWAGTGLLALVAWAFRRSVDAEFTRNVAILSALASAVATFLWLLKRRAVKTQSWIGVTAALAFAAWFLIFTARLDRLCALVK